MVRTATLVEICVIVASLGCASSGGHELAHGERAAGGGGASRASAGASGTRTNASAGAVASAGGAMSSPSIGFFHPGLLITSDDIARMKANIASRAEPYYSSFTRLRDDAESQPDKKIDAPSAIIGRNSASRYASTRYAAETAAVTAFQNALVYVLTGEVAHANKAVAILDSYAKTTQHFDKADPERDLEAAILGWLWVSTAELIRASGYTGWSADAVRQFNAWIYEVVYADTDYEPKGVLVIPLVNGAGARGAFGLRTKIAIGVYLDNQKIYDEAVEYFFHGRGNGAPDYYIDAMTGQTWEAGRDQGHAQGGLSRLIETAQIARNQGNASLYAWKDFALRNAVEYIASYNLGNEVSYRAMEPFTKDWADVYDTISAAGRGEFATIYELPYAYFHSELAMEMPFAKQSIDREGVELFSAQNDNPMFATLIYRR
jgi:hypothetical protein